MSNTSLESIVSTLFTAPAQAVIAAEKEYLSIWKGYLESLAKELNDPASTLKPEEKALLLKERLNLVPVMKFQAAIDLGITMRIASVDQKSGNFSAGLQLNVFQASGGFGFMTQNTQESTFQARASYNMSNYDAVTLTQYLAPAKIDLTDPTKLDEAVKYLEKKQS